MPYRCTAANPSASPSARDACSTFAMAYDLFL